MSLEKTILERLKFRVLERLPKAILDGNENIVKNILPLRESSCWAEFPNGYDLLYKAATENFAHKSEIPDLLISHGFKVNSDKANTSTLLHEIILLEKLSSTKLLLQRGASITALDKAGRTALIIAARFNLVDIMTAELDQAVSNGDLENYVNIADKTGNTALHYAVSLAQKDSRGVELLLKHQADPNKGNTEGMTPIFMPCHAYGNSKTCELLLQSKANVEILKKNGRSLLQYAVDMGAYEVAKLLIETQSADVNLRSEDKKTAIFSARDEKFCKLLLEHNAKLNIYDKNQDSPLRAMVRRSNCYTIAKLLLQSKAPVNKKNKDKHSALYIAANLADDKMCALLLEFGADADSCDKNGKSTLHLAIEGLSIGIVRMLLENKANPNKLTTDGATPLHVAMTLEYTEMCDLLIEFGADPKIPEKDGLCALHYAAVNSLYGIAHLLLKNKAYVSVKTKNKLTPLYLSARSGNESIFYLLRRFGAKIDLNEKKEKLTILHHAVGHGWLSIIKEIFKKCNVRKSKFKNLFKTAVHNFAPYSTTRLLFNYGLDLSSGEMNDVKFIAAFVRKGYSQILLRALGKGLDINMGTEVDHDYCSCSLLHRAVKYKRTDMEKLLILHGAKIDFPNCDGESPLFCAVKKAYCHHGAESSRTCRDPLRFARNNLDVELVGQLITWGSKVDFTDKNGWTSLHAAISIGQLHLVKLLLRYDAEPNKQDKDGMTPIHLACQKPEPEILKVLLKSGADISITDSKNRTVFGHIKEDKSEFWASEEILQQHVFKFLATNLSKNKKILHLPTILVSHEFKQKCLAELEEIRKKNVGDLIITLFHILTCSLERLVIFMREEDFEPVISSSVWRKKFPIFQGMIYYKLMAANRQLKLAEDFQEVFRSNFSPVPELCLKKIVGYFDKKEIMKQIITFKIRQ